MATQPTNDLLVWANTDVNLPNLAGPNKTEPSADLVAKGWDFKQKPSANEFNYILNNLSEWVEYLRTLTTEGTPSNTPSTLVKRDSSGNFAATTITANLAGNANTATTWQTARTLTATGFATGTAAGIDGSGNINLVLSMGSGFSNSKTTNGYTYLPNGLIFQWGTATVDYTQTSTAVTFPTTFPSACSHITVTPMRSTAVTGVITCYAHTVSTIGFSIFGDYDTNSTPSVPTYWFAIGY